MYSSRCSASIVSKSLFAATGRRDLTWCPVINAIITEIDCLATGKGADFKKKTENVYSMLWVYQLSINI